MQFDLEKVLQIRSAVLSLGQKGAGEWWPCLFLTPAGERFLSTPFPRSAYWAALHATSIAAARHHDERIGTGGTVHLFRLGPELEIRLRDKVLRDGWRPASDGDEPLDLLKAAGEGAESTPSPGPIRVSDTHRFATAKTLAQVAGLYAEAFDGGFQILPYGSEK